MNRQGLSSSSGIALFAWHAVHRIFHSLHDVGIRAGPASKALCYGSALAITPRVGCGAACHRLIYTVTTSFWYRPP
jgi:fumarate reductase subunit D